MLYQTCRIGSYRGIYVPERLTLSDNVHHLRRSFKPSMFNLIMLKWINFISFRFWFHLVAF